MKPQIGEIVHYVSYGTPGGEFPSKCRAAVVAETMPDDAVPGDAFTNTDPETVVLCVLNPKGIFFDNQIRHDEKQAPGTWHYPCGQ